MAEISWIRNPGARVWAGVAIAAGVVVAALAAVGGSVPAALGGLLFALLAYASMWRPAVGLTEHALLLRGMYSTQVLPLARVESVRSGRMLAVTVDGRRYVSSALASGLRDGRRAARAEGLSLQEQVEVEIRARAEQRGAGPTAEPVRREWAWLDVALSLAVAVAVVVTAVV